MSMLKAIDGTNLDCETNLPPRALEASGSVIMAGVTEISFVH